MTIPIYIKNDIKKLYAAASKEIGTSPHIRLERFCKIVKNYYPWFNSKEMLEIISIITKEEKEYHRKVWIKQTTNLYTLDIVKLFGIIDVDNNATIDINEFKKIVKLVNNINEEELESLFKEADSDNNNVLDIFEFINFLSKHDNLRNDFLKVLTKTKEKNKLETHDRLSIIFNNVPNSPIRINWRPSLADLKSPTEIIYDSNSYY